MPAQMGEYVVGAYLKLKLDCQFVDYNVRSPGGGLGGLNELDVIGLNFAESTAYLCEVTTHIRGLLYKDNRTTIARVKRKHEYQKEYAARHLRDFQSIRYMLWFPVVPVGYLTEGLTSIGALELVINGDYAQRVAELQELAAAATHDTGNPFFRALQILQHMRA